MKIIKDSCFMTVKETFDHLDRIIVSEVSISCPCCGHYVRLTEAYINNQQKQTIEDLCNMLNGIIDDIDKAVVEIYGEDVRMIQLAKKLNKIKMDFYSPKLKIIK